MKNDSQFTQNHRMNTQSTEHMGIYVNQSVSIPQQQQSSFIPFIPTAIMPQPQWIGSFLPSQNILTQEENENNIIDLISIDESDENDINSETK